MQQKIIEFTNLLRKSGVRVSVAEAIDAFLALDEVSLGDREVFQDALRTTMVKRGEDIATFDHLFDLYWSAFYDGLRDAFDKAAQGAAGERELDLEELMRADPGGACESMQGELDLSELAKALLTQDLSKLEQLIRQAAEQSGRGPHREHAPGRLLHPPHDGADGRRGGGARAARPRPPAPRRRHGRRAGGRADGS